MVPASCASGKAGADHDLVVSRSRAASPARIAGVVARHPTEELVVDPEGEADTFAAMVPRAAAATVVGILQQLDEDSAAVFALV